MKIHVIYAGGTIGMIDSPRGLIPGADMRGWLRELLARQLGTPTESTGALPLPTNLTLTWTQADPLIDSSNADATTWQWILDDIADAATRHRPDAYLILHGTDTLAYTASALSYAYQHPQPLVITGAQHPLGFPGTDADANVTLALAALHHYASQAPAARPGVLLAFGGMVLRGNRATKSSSWALNAFDSPSAPALYSGQWRGAAHTPRPITAPDPGVCYGNWDVPVIDLMPGQNYHWLRHLTAGEHRPHALILRAFGAGNIPTDHEELLGLIQDLTNAGTVVALISQCHQSQVDLGRYATGSAAHAAGATGMGDMTLEAAYTKILYLLSKGLRGTALSQALTTPLAGEMTQP